MITTTFTGITGSGLRQRCVKPSIATLQEQGRPFLIVCAHGAQRGNWRPDRNWPKLEDRLISLVALKQLVQRDMLDKKVVLIVDTMSKETWSFHVKWFVELPNEVWVLKQDGEPLIFVEKQGTVPPTKQPTKETTMISAQEAKALYDASGAEADAFLKHSVEPKVKNAAGGGKRSVEVLIGAADAFDRCVPSPVMMQVMNKLSELGYVVSYERYGDEYVPRAFADDDGNGPKHRNYGLIIRW